MDTNVLAYAVRANVAGDKALNLITPRPPEAIVLPAQTLSELYNVLVRKSQEAATSCEGSRAQLARRLLGFDTSATAIVSSMDLASEMALRNSGSTRVVMAASAEAECRLLLSEDLQEGFT